MSLADASIYSSDIALTSENSLLKYELSRPPIVRVIDTNGHDYSGMIRIPRDENVLFVFHHKLTSAYDYAQLLISLSRSSSVEEDTAFEEYLNLFEVR